MIGFAPLASAPIASLPAEAAAAGVTIAAPVADIAIAGALPGISAGAVVVSPVASIVLAGIAPDVTAGTGVIIAAPVAGLALAGLAPSLVIGVSIAAPSAGIALAGIAPSISAGTGVNIIAPTADLGVAGLAPSLVIGAIIASPSASLLLDGIAPSISTSASIIIARPKMSHAGLRSPLSGIRSPFGVRSAGFTPADLTGLELWYDANVTASISTTGSHVTAWADQSGNGRDLLNGSGSDRPQYPGTALNGVATIDFNDDLLSVAGFTIAQPWSYAIVVRATNNGFGRAIISTNSGSRSQVGQQNVAAPAPWSVHCGTEVAIDGPNDGSSWFILVGTNNGAASYGNSDALPVLLASSPGTAGLTGFRMGRDALGFQPLIGQTAEVIVWSSAYSAQDMANVLAYLQSKWSL